MPPSQSIDRRQFAKQLSMATGSAAFLLAGNANLTDAQAAQETPQSTKEEPNQKPPPPRRPSQEVLLLNLLIARYPHEHFDEAAMKEILADLRADIGRGRILSSCGLQNSEEPAMAFRAYRGPEE